MDANNDIVGPVSGRYTASDIGLALVKQYFDVLGRFPDQAWRFYAKRGVYQTVYPDGTAAVATDQKELCKILLRPAPAGFETIEIDSVQSVACGSLDRVLVVATGPRFLQSFYLDRRAPEEQRTYAITASVTRFSTPSTAVDRPPVDAAAVRLTTAPAAGRLPSVPAAVRLPSVPAAGRLPSVPAAVRLPSAMAAVRLPSAMAAKRKPETTKKRVSFADVIATTVVFDKNLPPTSVSAGLRGRANAKSPASAKLFVGCLPKTVKPQELADTFAAFGPVSYVRLKDGGYNRHGLPSHFNYGFVQFDSPSSANAALGHRPISINGHVLNVNLQITGGDRRL